jgi:RNA polymerase sigma-70 factor (ECF subfamily)
MRRLTDDVDLPAERACVERFLARGEEAAFRALYHAHCGYLFRLAMRLCGGRREQAEDAVQEAWLRAAQMLARFRWESRLRTWLAGILINCCREERRRSARPLHDGFAARGRDEQLLDLEAAVRELPDGLREVLVLHSIEGYTHEEIGSLLGIAAGTSKSRLFDARAVLRDRLAATKER